MCIPKVAPFTSFQMAANAAAYRTQSTGPVLLAYGSSNLRISGFLRNVLGNAAIKPRYRKIAVRPEAPQEAAWTEGTQYTGSGTGFSEDFSLSGLGAFLFVQPAIGGAVTTGSNGEGLDRLRLWAGAPTAKENNDSNNDNVMTGNNTDTNNDGRCGEGQVRASVNGVEACFDECMSGTCDPGFECRSGICIGSVLLNNQANNEPNGTPNNEPNNVRGTGQDVRRAMAGHVLASAKIVGLYAIHPGAKR